MVGNSTKHHVRLSEKLKEDEFSGEIKGAEGNNVTLSVQAAPDAIVGRWNLLIRCGITAKHSRDGDDGSDDGDDSNDGGNRDNIIKWNDYRLPKPITILFNAWCSSESMEYVISKRISCERIK